MTTNRPQAQVEERRIKTADMVDKWLQERQQMLVLFCQLSGLDSYPPDQPVKQLLTEFCQVLMDYTAFGHFEVFDRINRGAERRLQLRTLAETLYPKIVRTTELAVAFNDKYDTSDHDQPLDRLDADLSQLGEVLAGRIELEDRLVAALVNRG